MLEDGIFRYEVDRALIIPDVHMDIRWVEHILEKEGGWDLLVFLGDYFDSSYSPPRVSDSNAVAEYFRKLKETWGEKLVLLLGNHDIQYLEARRWLASGHPPLFGLRYLCSGYDDETAKSVHDHWDDGFCQSLRLFALVNGFLLSHAGVAGLFFRDDCSVEEAFRSLDAQCDIAVERLNEAELPILKAGRARGGEQDVGGITWLDWNFEFSDDEIPTPQIVGHTQSSNPGKGARQNGRSWCIDGGQSCYGILEGTELRIEKA